MGMVRQVVVWATLLGGGSAWAQKPMDFLSPPMNMPKKSPITPLPGGEPTLPKSTPPAIWKPEEHPDEPPVPPHLQVIPDWYPSPPPANYTTSSCNFNVWCGSERFSPDFSTCQVLLGGYTSIPGLGPRIPDFTYAPLTVRYSWMLNAPQDTTAFYRGNLEYVFDLTIAPITSGIGKAIGGPTLLWRYNFVQPNAGVIPYIQAGGGFHLTDAYKQRDQRAIGQGFNVVLRTEIGVRCFIAENWSLDIEGGYQYISNAQMATRNYGVNAIGAQIGFTYFFPSGGR